MVMQDFAGFGRLLKIALFTLVIAACSGSGENSPATNSNTGNNAGNGDNSVTVGTVAPLAALAGTNVDYNSILIIEIQWTLVKKPLNSQATIINANTANPIFKPDLVGEYVIRVVIKQGGEVLAENEVKIYASVDDVFPLKPATHILSTDICTACHAPDTWVVTVVDHNQVIGACSSCHNNVIARGQGPAHIATSSECDLCHTTSAWVTPVSFDHSAVVGACITCHDAITASGKSPTHPNTTDVCDACHSVLAWVPVVAVDHTQTLGVCMDCHAKSASHPLAGNDCAACHSTNAWIPAVYPGAGGGDTPPEAPPSPAPIGGVDHSGFVGTCVSCHNGLDASGKSASHPLTTDQCDACHEVTIWAPVAAVDHNHTIGSCQSCHDGVIASGMGPTHIATSDDCSACHVTSAWLPALSSGGTGSGGGDTGTAPAPTPTPTPTPGGFDHSTAIGTCVSCHNGTDASGKGATHINTTDVCDACHSTNMWVPVAPSSVDHNQVLGSCSTCHNNVIATGKGPTHINTSLECDVCHTTELWVAPMLDHTTLTGACVTCHNGISASGKSSSHINSTDNCAACHAIAPAPWTPVAPSSVDHNEVIGVCSSCHNGIIASGKSATHVVTRLQCDVCHTTSSWLP